MSKKLIIAGYNNFNLGDDLMFASTINLTKYDDYFMYGQEIKPHFVEKPIKFIRDGRLEVLRWKVKADFALVGGSLFMGDNEVNLSRFNWKIKLLKLNKFLGGRNFVMGANLGPFIDKEIYLSKLREVAALVDHWKVRDRFSAELLDEINVKSFEIIPDLVMSMDISPFKSVPKKNVVSISVTKVEKDGNHLVKQSDFENEIVALCKKYIDNGYHINLLSFEDSKDIAVALSVKNQINSKNVKIEHYRGKNIIESIAESEFLISTRFHCMIIGALLGKKQIIYEYSEKTRNFADKYGFKVYQISGNLDGKGFGETHFDNHEKHLAEIAIKNMGKDNGY